MSNNKLAIINRVIEEHQTIKEHIKLVGDSISDREALGSLERARPDWIPGRLEIMSEKLRKLQQTISSLDEGLKNHFTFEEAALPPLLGTLLMQALILDHQEIKNQISGAKSMATKMKPEGLSREELLSQEAHIQQTISSICQLVEEHATKEEIILEMLRRTLQEQNKS